MKILKTRTVCTEITGLTPSMMQHAGEIEEVTLSDEKNTLLSTGYTSPYVKNVIKDQVIDRSHKFKCVAKSLKSLIDLGTITPVMFSNSDSYAMMVDMFNVYEYEKRIMGFYQIDENKIYLLLNNLSIGASGSISNTSILSLMFHELMHYSFKNVKKDYMKIFNDHMIIFYSEFFKSFYELDIPNELIVNYLQGLYNLEATGKTEEMIDTINEILDYAQENGDENIAFMNSKAVARLFEYLSMDINNETGVKLGQLSQRFFREHMIKAYNVLFSKISPELYEIYKSRHKVMEFRSVFYQEFIASSEVSAMIAGSMVKELMMQQSTLNASNPIANMINTI